jgi:hypothetical protein
LGSLPSSSVLGHVVDVREHLSRKALAFDQRSELLANGCRRRLVEMLPVVSYSRISSG